MKIIENLMPMYQQPGEYHLSNGLENQDVVFGAENRVAKIIAIADGVSSCSKGKRGAEIACEAIGGIMLNETSYVFSASPQKIAALLSTYVYGKLLFEAKSNNELVEQYASTLSFVCFNKLDGRVMTFVLGDSLIYRIDDAGLSLAVVPELLDGSKTYATTTKGVANVIKVSITQPTESISYLLATDGAWKTFYANGKLSEEAEQAAKNKNIIGYLKNQHCKDDCSVIMMDVPKGA